MIIMIKIIIMIIATTTTTIIIIIIIIITIIIRGSGLKLCGLYFLKRLEVSIPYTYFSKIPNATTIIENMAIPAGIRRLL